MSELAVHFETPQNVCLD